MLLVTTYYLAVQYNINSITSFTTERLWEILLWHQPILGYDVDQHIPLTSIFNRFLYPIKIILSFFI